MAVKICQVNINGMSTNTIMALDNYVWNQKIDILCLSETKVKDLPHESFPNMISVSKPNKENPLQRGVLLMANRNIPLTRYPELEPPTADMIVCIAKVGGIRYFLCSVYSPPNDKGKLQEVLNATNAIIDQMPILKVKGLMMFGDLNARHTTWGDHTHNSAGSVLSEFTRAKGLNVIYKHKGPTFLCENGSSHIDLFIGSEGLESSVRNQYTDDTVELFTGAPRRGHVPVITKFGKHTPDCGSKMYYKWKEADWNSFSLALEMACEQYMPKFTTSEDPAEIWCTLKAILAQCRSAFVPSGISSLHSKPYWSDTLSDLSRRLRAARRKFKYRSTYENGDILECAKTQFQEALTSAKRSYIECQSHKLNTRNSNTFWRNFKHVFYKREDNSIGDLVDPSGQVMSDDHSRAHYLFSSMFGGQHQDTELPQPSPPKHNSVDYEAHLDQLNKPISIEEITDSLKRLQTSGKSPDFDGVHPLMLKQGTNFFIIALHCLFNQVMRTHTWPWGESNLVVFLKKLGKKDYTSASSYRPITISSYVGKTLERVLEQRLRLFVESWKVIPDSQYGFRQNRSTLMYALRLLTEATHHVKNKQPTAALFLDLQKAFDTVWHDGIIHRLLCLGIKGSFIMVVQSFLKNRKLTLKINNFLHNPVRCEKGLPQGSVLSPLLFILYIKDMLLNIKGTCLQYADDCTVLMTAKTSAELQGNCQANCQLIQNWMLKWKLEVNYQKTELVVFNGNLRPSKMGNNTLQVTGFSKVLGITVDDKLTFDRQRSACIRSIEQKMNMMKPYLYSGLNCRSARSIFTLVILPKALYGASLWDTNNKVTLTSHLKLLLGAHYNPPTGSLNVLIRVPPVELIYTKERLQLVKGLARIGQTHILSNTPKSLITKAFMADTRKLIHRSTLLEEIKQSDLTKAKINNLIQTLWKRQWRLSLTNNLCPYGLISDLPPDHLFKFPVPLETKRKDLAALCDLLTGHNRLQLFQYRINMTYSPLCTCLEEEESVSHYIYSCQDYSSARAIYKPSPNDWSSLTQYIIATQRLQF